MYPKPHCSDLSLTGSLSLNGAGTKAQPFLLSSLGQALAMTAQKLSAPNQSCHHVASSSISKPSLGTHRWKGKGRRERRAGTAQREMGQWGSWVNWTVLGYILKCGFWWLHIIIPAIQELPCTSMQLRTDVKALGLHKVLQVLWTHFKETFSGQGCVTKLNNPSSGESSLTEQPFLRRILLFKAPCPSFNMSF